MTHQKPQEDLLTDDRIIDLYWDRNETAIRETDLKYGRFLYSIAYHILHDKCDCEECCNDTYLRVWNAVPPERPTVLRGIAFNRLTAKNRQKRVPAHLIDDMDDVEYFLQGDRSVEEEVAVKELAKNINDYIKTLTQIQQHIFVGRYYFSESVEEIAKTVQMTRSNIYKQLNQIKQGLKIYLEERGEKID